MYDHLDCYVHNVSAVELLVLSVSSFGNLLIQMLKFLIHFSIDISFKVPEFQHQTVQETQSFDDQSNC